MTSTEIKDMTNLRKYSREWFAQNSSQQQKEAINKYSEKLFQDTRKDGALPTQIFNYDTFVGDKASVLGRFKELQKDEKNKKECDLINRFGGVESIFNIIDANSDGVVSGEELSGISAVDTPEWCRENSTFSVNDLHHVYWNYMEAQGAEVVEDGNTATYKYKDGSEVVIKTDDNGELVSKKQTYFTFNGKVQKEISWDYETKTKTTLEFDSKGRVQKEVIDKQGNVDDRTTSTEFLRGGRRNVTVSTAGRTQQISYDKKGNIIKESEEFKYNIDGVIDDIYQRNVGDCWYLSAVNSLKSTESGRQMIQDSITKNDDGSVTVTLKGVNKSYTYTPEQICSRQYLTTDKLYSKGDDDMALFEMAMADCRIEMLEEKNEEYIKKFNLQKTKITDPLTGGGHKEGIFCLTGVDAESKHKNEDKQDFINKKLKEPKRYALVCNFQQSDDLFGYSVQEPSKTKIVKNHTYSISRVTEDTVYVVNPWNSSEELAYPKEKFLKNSKVITLADFGSAATVL